MFVYGKLSLVKRNNCRNTISAVENLDGHLTTSFPKVVHAFTQHFEEQLGKKLNQTDFPHHCLNFCWMLPTNQHANLICMSSNEEIKDARDQRAPSSDGYGSKFFKSAWDIVSADFVVAVGEFFHNGKLLERWNHTLTALIPKSAHADKVTDCRSISCCTVFYKVIFKLLAARLSEVLGHIFHQSQAAFV